MLIKFFNPFGNGRVAHTNPINRPLFRKSKSFRFGGPFRDVGTLGRLYPEGEMSNCSPNFEAHPHIG